MLEKQVDPAIQAELQAQKEREEVIFAIYNSRVFIYD